MDLFSLARWTIALFAMTAAPPAAATANQPPTVTGMPAVSSARLVADGTTVYTVSMTASDPDGYAGLSDMRVMFNYTESDSDPAYVRGYLAWGATDAQITRFGHQWVLADANGGGRWGYCSDSWGRADYFTPVSCQVVVSGGASGATGSRTVTWSFTVKPAWAANPLVNDADAWASDGTHNIGWLDNPAGFDVVASPCILYSATPRAPVVTTVASDSLVVSIDPADSSTDLFLIQIRSGSQSSAYVQADGSLGSRAAWRSKSEWQATRVSSLSSSTTYELTARAYGNSSGVCPSDFGPAASAATAVLEHVVDAGAVGKPISRGIIGNATRLEMPVSMPVLWTKTWDILDRTFARGIAGGLDADTYNWKDMSGQGVGHTGAPGPAESTTLSWMRLIREYQSTPLVTANLRGIGPLSSSGYCSFYYTDISVQTVSQLAADWVRYTNRILPHYRRGDILPAADQAIVDSINWYGRPKLLEPGEAATPPVVYWEIGNEPELALPWCTSGATTYGPPPAEYAARYKQIALAMKAVDPAIKVGPCITTAGNSVNAHLAAVLGDPAAPVDFVSYHPYGPLYWFANTYGDTEAVAESGLLYIRTLQAKFHSEIRNVIAASGRNPDSIQMIASEWNSSDWRWEGSTEIRRVSHGLSVAETIWNFADLGLTGAVYWSYACWGDGTETPMYKVFEMFREQLGTELIDTFSNDVVRVYASRQDRWGPVTVWLLNLSADEDKPLQLKSANLGIVTGATMKRLANVNGETHLFDRNDPPASAASLIDWFDLPVPGTEIRDLVLTLPHSTATVVTIHQRQPAEGDLDADGDVDQSDFGAMQACFSGQYVAQNDLSCATARLDGDSDVDQADLAMFLQCMQGPGVERFPGCSQQ